MNLGNYYKGISRDTLYKDGNARFTTVPLNLV